MTIAGAAVAGIAGYTIATYRKKDDDNTNLAPGKSGDQVLERSADTNPPNPPDGNGGGNGNKVEGEKPTPTPGATDQPGTNKPDPAKGAASTDDKPATSLHTAICLTVIAGLAIAGAVLCYTIVKPADTSQAVSGIVRAAYATLQVNQSNHADALNILGLPSSERSTLAKNLEDHLNPANRGELQRGQDRYRGVGAAGGIWRHQTSIRGRCPHKQADGPAILIFGGMAGLVPDDCGCGRRWHSRLHVFGAQEHRYGRFQLRALVAHPALENHGNSRDRIRQVLDPVHRRFVSNNERKTNRSKS